jgi:type I restriction enzyme S subunit
MSDWISYRLGDITEWFSGGTPSKQDHSYWGGDIPWISAKTLKETRVSYSELTITETGLKKGSRLANKGDLLLLVRGSGLFNAIPVAIVEKPVAFNQDIKSIRIKTEFDYISPWFLLYWFKSNTRLLNGIMEVTGIGAGKFDTKQLQDLIIEIPPKEELDELTKTSKSIDDKIHLLRQQNQTLEQIAQTLFKQWFVDFEFPNENGQPYKSSGGQMVESELGEIPEGWEVVELKDIVDIGSSKRIFASEYKETGVPFYRGKEITELSNGNSISTEIFISESRYQELKNISGVPQPDNILLTSVGTIGNTYLVQNGDKFYFKDGNLTWIKEYKNHIKYDFVFEWLNSKQAAREIEGIKIGSTQQAITIASLNTILLVIPNELFYNRMKDSFRFNINKRQLNQKQIETLSDLRDTLLPKLMSGEIRVNTVSTINT